MSFDETMDQLVILDWQQDVKLKTSNVLIAPEELGTYVYVVTAYWGEMKLLMLLNCSLNKFGFNRKQKDVIV